MKKEKLRAAVPLPVGQNNIDNSSCTYVCTRLHFSRCPVPIPMAVFTLFTIGSVCAIHADEFHHYVFIFACLHFLIYPTITHSKLIVELLKNNRYHYLIQCPLGFATLDKAAALGLATSRAVTDLCQYINSDLGYSDLEI